MDEAPLQSKQARAGFYPIEALDASGTGRTTYFVAAKLVSDIEKAGRNWHYYGMLSACEVLADPICIYEGLNRKGYENAVCYVGCPKRYGEDWSGPPLPDHVFVVCISEHQVMFEWGWEKADDTDKTKPENANSRFRKLKWKRSSST